MLNHPIFAIDSGLQHMRDIKQTGMCACVNMRGCHSVLILNRHRPPSKIHHLTSMLNMEIMQTGFLQLIIKDERNKVHDLD